jgi:protein gp37
LGDAFHKIVCREDLLDLPSRCRAPRMFFVSDDGDLMHEQVPDDFIHRVIETMRASPKHGFMVCTKRSARLADFTWPSNVAVGVSAENQATFDARVPDLLRTVCTERFISMQPLLGPISMGDIYVNWVTVGAEYGAGAEALDEDWVRALRDESHLRGVAFTYQQNMIAGVRVLFPKLDGKKHYLTKD